MSQLIPSHSVPGILFRHFGLGTLLILGAAAVLLFSDPRWHREQRSSDAPKKVAVFNYVTVPTLEDGEAGAVAGLKEAGFVEGENLTLSRYNAEGDRSTAIMISKEIVGGDFDLILTLSTPVLQSLAAANLDTRRTHVFTLSTDPWGAGVGISRENHLEHPPYMTGEGSIPPIGRLFEMAREANPGLKKVGVVWNPAESNSEAAVKLARAICKKLKIELVEMNVDSSSGVQDATRALIARQVEAIWTGGDATVAAAHDTLISTAANGGVPVFSSLVSNVKGGALFSLGPDYYEVGHAGGLLAGRVLKGADPATIPVDNFAPQVLALNLVTQEKYQAKWHFGADWAKRARLVVDQSGAHDIKQSPPSARGSSAG
ncbi:MAG TPA: ABC transporter substrate-binding protein [Planctomycetaceae bacterium]|nr:ABC transporter substrate-binding protein [Planctomycetaceae bacterium]